MRFARYEVLLPLLYNSGAAVEASLIEDTREELLLRFGGISEELGGVRGSWIHERIRYEDELIRLTVDCDDTRANRQFFNRLKETLKERFEQLEIRITFHRIEVL